MTIEGLIAQYGAFAILLGAAVEGETAVLLGGLLVARGGVGYVPAMVAAALGSFIADQFFFAVGRRMRNHHLVQKVQAKRGFARAKRALERHPTGFILAFRFLYGLRTVSPVAIGTTDVPVERFVLLNAIAAAAWGAIFVTLGRFFGEAIFAALGRVRHAERWIGLALVVAIVLALCIRIYLRVRERAAEKSRLDAGGPDPLGGGDD